MAVSSLRFVQDGFDARELVLDREQSVVHHVFLFVESLQHRRSTQRDPSDLVGKDLACDVRLDACVLGGLFLLQAVEEVQVVPELVVALDVVFEAVSVFVELGEQVLRSVGRGCR